MCHFSAFLPSKIIFLALSSRLSSVIWTFETGIPIFIFEPSLFVLSMPSTNTLYFLVLTPSILPVLFLNSPLSTMTLSPFLTLMLLRLCFVLSSFDSGAAIMFFLRFRGAFILYFRCLRVFLLDFHVREKSFILHYYSCYFCYARIAVSNLLRDWPFHHRSFWIALVIF